MTGEEPHESLIKQLVAPRLLRKLTFTTSDAARDLSNFEGVY